VRLPLSLLAAVSAALLLLGPAQGAFPGSNGLIAYSCNGTQVCKVNPDGSAAAVLVTSGTDIAWSPSGAKIAYTKSGDIYTANGDGSNEAIFATSGSQPAWSSDSATIAFLDGAGHVAVKTSSSTQEVSTGVDQTPAISPNGQTVVYSSLVSGTYQLFTVPINGGTPTQRTTDSGDHLNPTWSPDGTTILYENSTGIAKLVGGTITQVVNGDAHDPAYAPSGTKIAYVTTAGALVTANADGTGATPIVSSFANADEPDWGSAALTAGPSTPSDTTGGPTNTSYPTITLASGDSSPVIGHSLFTSPGTWSGTFPISYAYQWKRCDPADPVNGSCFNITGATSSTYTPTSADYGMRLRVSVSATNPDGRHTQNSEVTAQTVAIAPKNTSTPRISTDRPVVDTALTLTAGVWNGSTPLAMTYSWRRCNPVGDLASCVQIPGATSTSYTPTVADIGFSIRVWITASNVAGSDAAITNHTFPIVDKQHFSPTASNAPAIAGTALPGRQLTANIGTFAGDAPIATTFHWYRCDATGDACHAIAGADKIVYYPTDDDIGFTLRLVVFASNAYGKLVARSEPTETVAGNPPHVRGRHIVGTAGRDYLPGGGHDDVIYGEAGNDTIVGGAGDDRLYGGRGNDVITGGPGADRIDGGPGSDSIDVADGERDVVECGDGRDRVVADAYDIVAKSCEIVVVKPSS
jgi:Tol biopolymer transport system component